MRWTASFARAHCKVHLPRKTLQTTGIILFAALMAGCSGAFLLTTPNPRSKTGSTVVQESTDVRPKQVDKTASSSQNNIASSNAKPQATEGTEWDFSTVFSDSCQTMVPSKTQALNEALSVVSAPLDSFSIVASADSLLLLQVPRRWIRVALYRRISHLTLYTMGQVSVGAAGLSQRLQTRGRMNIQACTACRSQFSVRFEAGSKHAVELALPCTLMLHDSYAFFDLDGTSYRGSIVIVPEEGGRFMVLNVLDIEDYLRGVVPLEIGSRSAEEIEAVKAQAVVARTYAYKRIIDRRSEAYDVLSTIDDQVYGGMTAETRQTDMAVLQTADVVLAYGDSLITAYYHASCGGRTANVNDVWNKPAMPYLVSRPDTNKDGVAYCSMPGGRPWRWRERWTVAQLSAILNRTLAGKHGCSGTVRDIQVESRFTCGRVRSCSITLSQGICRSGGDAIRFVLRRSDRNQSILPSSNFYVDSINASSIKISGVGYGHGVGMCQMGAVGRARCRQSWQEIVYAYYNGVHIARVVVQLGTNHEKLKEVRE